MNKNVGLIILDGWGLGDHSVADAVYNAKTPCMDSLVINHPNSQLLACGEAVGLPHGQMGNSEVGHLNIGAGRIVFQELSRINNAISDGSFFKNNTLINALTLANSTGCKIHLLGLVSHGGVHSAYNHLEALLTLCKSHNASRVYIHAITDGRDCAPTSAEKDLLQLEQQLSPEIKLATVIGRYYAMDRDHRWERIKKAYDLFVHGIGSPGVNVIEAITQSYKDGITDEFIAPLVFDPNGLIEPGDVVISFNFRTDRPREIAEVLSQKAIPEYGMNPLSLHYVTMTNYDDSFRNMHVIFQKDNLEATLGEVLANHKKTQVRIAETEKYPHVTYFFSGGREHVFEGEARLLIESPKVATYDLQPSMSAEKVASSLISFVQTNNPDFFCLNFANPDMVGHTGVYEAIIEAVETVDHQLERIITHLKPQGYSFVVIADHGNADFAINPDGTPNTAHSLNKVPCIVISEGVEAICNGILADVAPTVLNIMGLPQPSEMTGKSLITKGA